MAPLSEFLKAPGEKFIYHYTPLATVTSIGQYYCDNWNRWRAFAVGGLNDKKELIHGLEILTEIMNEQAQLKSGSVDTAWKDIRNGIAEGVNWILASGIFAASFSFLEDDLKQWFTYGDGGSGVCLKVDKNEIVEKFWCLTGRVIYTNDEKIKIGKSVCANLCNWLSRDDCHEDRHLNFALDYLVTVAAFFKDERFASEKESRMVIPRRIYRTTEIKVINQGGALRCYVEIRSIDHNTERNWQSQLPLVEVMLGPRVATESNKIALNHLFNAYQDKTERVINISGSQCPIR